MCMCIYIYIYTHMCVHIYIYINYVLPRWSPCSSRAPSWSRSRGAGRRSGCPYCPIPFLIPTGNPLFRREIPDSIPYSKVESLILKGNPFFHVLFSKLIIAIHFEAEVRDCIRQAPSSFAGIINNKYMLTTNTQENIKHN